MLYQLLLVGLGGAAGSVARFGCQRGLNLSYPFGTLTANLLGCFLVGLLGGWLSRQPDETRSLLLMTGFCGGFTTFSAFSLETVQLLREGRWTTGLGYIAISVAAGVALSFFGFKCTSNL